MLLDQMLLDQAQLTADQVLRAFHYDEPYLFLGSAFTTVAIIAIGFCVLRRRWDGLLICLAIFAHLYGQRLWLESEVLRISLRGIEFFSRLRAAGNYLVPVPAFIFFYVAGFLGKPGKFWVWFLCICFCLLTAATLVFGALHIFAVINNTLVIVALVAVLLRSILQPPARTTESTALRVGLLCFINAALWDNIAGIWIPSRFEPYGFAVFLASLGYVAAHRALQREEELNSLQQELDLARRIQLSILPAAFPDSASFQVAARYLPMLTVAGDFYDFLVANDREAGLLIADVTGHGVPAALIASMVKMAALSQREHAADPGRILTAMNAALCGHTQDQYVTAACVHLDAVSGTLHYSAAGHPPMLLLRNGQVAEIVENGFILAAHGQSTFATASHPLLPGDRLMLYTDGLIEAANTQGEFFNEHRLYAALRDTAQLSPLDAADRILSSVQQWAHSQEDDLTLLICDYRAARFSSAASY